MTQIKIVFPSRLPLEINKQLDRDIADNNKIKIGIWEEIKNTMITKAKEEGGEYIIHRGYKVSHNENGDIKIQNVRGEYDFYQDLTLEEEMIFNTYGFLKGVILLGVIYFDEQINEVNYLLTKVKNKLSKRKLENLKAERSWLKTKLQEYKSRI